MLGFAPEQQKATPSYGEEERDFFENKIVPAQGLAQPAENFNMEPLPSGSMKVNVRNMIPKLKPIK